ncbi:MAG: SAM-dependent methyltransferase [Pyrinomonadaceae bacterium]|nr:SAM-dependent methyltransferase [Pyrinomonadaceae bacterium]
MSRPSAIAIQQSPFVVLVFSIMVEHIENFVSEIAKSIQNGTFVKLSLANYKGSEPHLQKILIRLVETKKGVRLYFLYRSETRDVAKNYDFDLGLGLIATAFDDGFRNGHLFTTAGDLQLDISNKGKTRLNRAKPAFRLTPPLGHDREKAALVDANSFYLKALGITDDTGRIKDKQQDKWRQINKFVEVMASLYNRSELREKRSLSIVDMGCGKGYLTFAAFDYFRNTLGLEAVVTGIDVKSELVDLCNGIARACDFDGLSFVVGRIDDFVVGDTDMLIALHACNTATDEALFKGIKANAGLILAAPCCHQEIRPQITPPAMLKDVLKHGVMLERFAEFITDGLRSLLLERSGYSTKLFEFVSTEHTPKNNMLAATRLGRPRPPEEFQRQIVEIKEQFGIDQHRLETLLGPPD